MILIIETKFESSYHLDGLKIYSKYKVVSSSLIVKGFNIYNFIY